MAESLKLGPFEVQFSPQFDTSKYEINRITDNSAEVRVKESPNSKAILLVDDPMMSWYSLPYPLNEGKIGQILQTLVKNYEAELIPSGMPDITYSPPKPIRVSKREAYYFSFDFDGNNGDLVLMWPDLSWKFFIFAAYPEADKATKDLVKNLIDSITIKELEKK